MNNRKIFLSYARVDDEVPSVEGNRPGWVRFFHDQLRVALRQRISRDLYFWRDVNDIAPDARFAREIEEALRQALLLVAIVSPNYLDRPWCMKELEDFIGLRPEADDDTRAEHVIKILKHNVPEGILPSPLRKRSGYKFFDVDPDRGIELPYFFAGRLLQRHEQAYLDLINEITERLANRLQPPSPEPMPIRTVFVAVPPAGSSVRETYIALTAELKRQNIAVIPASGKGFPDTLSDAERMLTDAVGAASLAIHLISESGGKICDGADESMVRLQLRHTAQEMERRPDLKRLIWLPDTVQAVNAQHAEFLEALRQFDIGRVPLLPGRDDVVSSTYEAFLDQIQRVLSSRQAALQVPTVLPADPVSLYVVAADEDVALARCGLRTLLKAEGVIVDVSLPTSQPADRRAHHEAVRLQIYDRAVVLWGGQDVAWVEDQLLRLRQWQGLGRVRPFAGIALLIIDPDTEEKRNEDPTAPTEPRIDLRAGLDRDALAQLRAFLGASP